MKKVYALIIMLAFVAAPGLGNAEEYGTPAPLDPAFMQGISGGPIKPPSRNSGQANKPQANNKPSNNKPADNKPSGSNRR